MISRDTTGSFKLMKSMNRALILNTIRTHGPISRADIAKKTKLTPPTVTNISGELLKSGLINEGETGVSKGGRRPILLTINWNSQFVIGIDIGVRKVRLILTNLKAEIVSKRVEKLPVPLTADDLTGIMTAAVKKLIDAAEVDPGKLLGIGVGMHGIVDAEKGVSLYAPTLNLKDIPLKDVLEQAFRIPVKVENDAKTLALGERWYGGHGPDTDNLVCVNVGEGIGAGIIFNNRIYHGNDHIAGEIGHMVVDIDGPRCSCGNYGCLQTVAGGRALKEYVLREAALGRETSILEAAGGNPDEADGKIIYECALKGDGLALEAFAKTGRYLGLGLLNLIHLVNPPLVVIGGGVAKAGDLILKPVQNLVKQRGITEKAKRTDIAISRLGEEGTAFGAVTLVLADFFALEAKTEKR
ncbi:sugar kinase [Alteribacter lacisalsi]|uniref:Sugar kinase n=1 Tax=Alteribacter lacisalsi TaxID=2045244 RepID=A0A2W0HKC5_9BACI|nr:ROK family transcriptional regulator [Alteribacter lacisalsi]PYZ97532.1 sugar kinase [Alteribacter lacisalsi]